MSKTYYHSTSEPNFYSIIRDKQIITSPEGVVYCCETEEDSLKFAAIRSVCSPYGTAVIVINVPDDIEVEETFDHSEQFFKCKSYGIPCAVPWDWIDLDRSFLIKTRRVEE